MLSMSMLSQSGDIQITTDHDRITARLIEYMMKLVEVDGWEGKKEEMSKRKGKYDWGASLP